MKIAPSMLSSDFSRLKEEVERLEISGADYIHLDVMDGVFVPNLTFGSPIVSSIRKFTKLPFDVHLMILEPHRYINEFVESGADIITFHVEAESRIKDTIDLIKSHGKKVGLALKPGTDVTKLYGFLKYIDLVLIMTVEPGFGGQRFIKKMMEKVKTLKEKIDNENLDIKIEVDGGINEDTAKIAKSCGVDIAVSGTSVFKSKDLKKAIENLK